MTVEGAFWVGSVIGIGIGAVFGLFIGLRLVRWGLVGRLTEAEKTILSSRMDEWADSA